MAKLSCPNKYIWDSEQGTLLVFVLFCFLPPQIPVSCFSITRMNSSEGRVYPARLTYKSYGRQGK